MWLYLKPYNHLSIVLVDTSYISNASVVSITYLDTISLVRYFNGKDVDTPFDGLIALSDATTLWGLNESTLRKAITYGKLINGQDVCKFGKQWVVTTKAMQREYGEPKS